MRPARSTLTLSCILLAIAGGTLPASAGNDHPKTLYVDCASLTEGDGDKQRPFRTITSAVSAARDSSAQRAVTIHVAEGLCESESFPINLDFPVRLRGSRSPGFDQEALPLNSQDNDTIVTWVPPSPVPPTVANLVFFRITGPDVEISKLSIDGKILPETVNPGPQAPAPIAISAQGATNFEVDRLRIVRVGAGLRTQAASGRIRDTYMGTVGNGIVITGGNPASPPQVIAANNRIEDYWTGAFAVGGAGLAGQSIRAVIENNDIATSYSDTGPSNPYGLRMNAIVPGTPFLEGAIDLRAESNRFRGSPRYAILATGGAPVRRANADYSVTLHADLVENAIDPAAITGATSLITFTNSRATELPCELDPTNSKAECPSLAGNPLQYWEYLEGSGYSLRHSGELDGALVDHPAVDPVDGRPLNNVLLVNDQLVEHQTFVTT